MIIEDRYRNIPGTTAVVTDKNRKEKKEEGKGEMVSLRTVPRK